VAWPYLPSTATHHGGRAATIDSVAPAVDHPLHLMERDGGISVELTDGSTLWLFGDTTDDTTGLT
jgi:hypothetical protein